MSVSNIFQSNKGAAIWYFSEGGRRLPSEANFFSGIPEKQIKKITILCMIFKNKLLVRNKRFFRQNIGSKLFYQFLCPHPPEISNGRSLSYMAI